MSMHPFINGSLSVCCAKLVWRPSACTPLWRNGPPDKPVLCNACGSRWRTKGTLANYTPLHARAESDDFEDHRISKVKSISINKNKEVKVPKRKANYDNIVVGGFAPDYNQGFRKVVDEDTSNRSSSGSAISNSESCVQFGSADASDLTGPAQSNAWDSVVPSRKRTCVNRSKPSPVEKLTKDLYTILHEQQSSYFSGSSEEDLLFESETPMVSVEIGHGSVLIRHPSSIAREEESEASSLSVENKQYSNEAYSRSVTLPVYNDNNTVNFSSCGINKAKSPYGQGMQQVQLKREKSQHEKLQILGNHNSPLCNIDLNDIINFKEFMGQLTDEEQQHLLKYLPPVDTDKYPDRSSTFMLAVLKILYEIETHPLISVGFESANPLFEDGVSLKSMFDSLQFKENLSSFQQLLAEGVFDFSFSGVKSEDCKTLKRLALSNFTTSIWVEHYHFLKKGKKSTGGSVVSRGQNIITSNNVNVKRSRDSLNKKFPAQSTVEFSDAKNTMRSPKRIAVKATYESKEHLDFDGSCFSPRSLFAVPHDGSSLMLESLHFVDESSDQDLLLDVPSNGSFAQAELLHPSLSFGHQASTSSSSGYPNHARP
ncbi:hypothetical protein JRO89_XS13G0066000 [Xanthoceras sorbifolium]|uniref:DEUBAD domain-containing protein n=1 Tax=Xanthoceras sorbifolium TaxID=99658 RepID=A0ABQ8H713_9ROSI|nr:hypothetical protein JRO89_XS13G0066000 [Xanthoceras sorbifolium]